LLYILAGPDEFSLQEKLDEIENGLGDAELTAVNTALLEGEQLTLNQLRDVCYAAPFLASKRLVMVKGLLARFDVEKKRGKRMRRSIGSKVKTESHWQSISRCLKTIPDTTVLVLIEGRIESNNPLFKEIAPMAIVKSFPLLTSSNLRSWIRSRVKDRGGSISPQAIELLAELVGGNLSALAQEIEKLFLYTNGRVIEEDDVRLLVSWVKEANVFAMVDAVLEHQASEAMLLLRQLLNGGVPPPYLVLMIARQLRLVVLAKELIAQGASLAEMGKQLGLSGYPLRKTLKQAREHSMRQLELAYGKLLDADVAFKTGRWQAIRGERWKDEFSLDIFISELCQEAS
jgi:DNA polymerase-3 subunit delta